MSKKLLGYTMFSAALLLMSVSGSSTATAAKQDDFKTFGCALRRCPVPLFRCTLNKPCRRTLECNRKCGDEAQGTHQQACHLVCQLQEGKNSPQYGALIQCLAEHECLPRLPEGTDGTCPVTHENIDKVYVLSDFADIEGTWVETRGLNCGVPGSNWEGGYDALPCRSDSWLYEADQWWYHTSFCAPSDTMDCNGEKPPYLLAAPGSSDEEPGMLLVPYVDPPLKPQFERWFILARPDPDWIMYTYCGSTPAGEYAGLNVITRVSEPWVTGMPPYVEAAFRQAADDFNFSYDKMCLTDQSRCPPVTAASDIHDWVVGIR